MNTSTWKEDREWEAVPLSPKVIITILWIKLREIK